MKRFFKLTVVCKNNLKIAPLALQCKEIILKEMPYLKVNIKEYGKKPTGGDRK